MKDIERIDETITALEDLKKKARAIYKDDKLLQVLFNVDKKQHHLFCNHLLEADSAFWSAIATLRRIKGQMERID